MSVVRAILMIILSVLFASQAGAQFWTENFETSVTGCNSIYRADTTTLASMQTLKVDTDAANVGFQNYWFVSSRFRGTTVGSCGTGCLITAGTDNSLHISTQTPSVDPFATYNSDSITNLIVYTDEIDMTGVSDVLLEFNYLLMGQDANDNAALGFAIGNGAFQVLDTLSKTDSVACGVNGEWVRYSIFLPANVGNIGLPNLRIGFRWYNDNDGLESDVSFAVDDMSMTEANPVANFGFNKDSICENGCINFSDSSTGNPIAWAWDFGPNATPSTSTQQNPQNVCFSTAGPQTIMLTATNSNGSDPVQLQVQVLDCQPPSGRYQIHYPYNGTTSAINAVSETICRGTSLDFLNASLDGTFGQGDWTWLFQGGVPSVVNLENPTNITYATTGVYDITLYVEDTASGKIDTAFFPDAIIVGDCEAPTAAFTSDTTEICNNDAINYEGLVTGNPDSVTWIFQGGNPSILTDEANQASLNPTVFYTTPGNWTTTLIVKNSAGADTTIITQYIRVNTCPKPWPLWTVNRRVICPGVAVVFEDQSLYATSWAWEFPGGFPSTSNDQNPQNIRYDSAGIYPVTLTVSNVNGDSLLTKEGYITVDSCLGPDARFEVESDSICRGSCVQFFNTSLRADSIFWVFNKVIPDTTLQRILLQTYSIDTNNIDTLLVPKDSVIRAADSIVRVLQYLTDTIFMLDDPILCFDDSLVVGLRLFTFNEYDVDVANFIDFPVLNIGGEYPEVSAGPDKIVRIDNINSRFFLEDTVQLEGEGSGRFFSWFPEDGLSCYDCPTPVIYPTETRKYYLTNMDGYGCEVYDSVTVFVEQAYFVGIPNIFSPNGDNENDVLWVRGNGISAEGFVMRVWDRYGKMVFESYNQNDGWDGNFKGAQAPQGAYMYEVRLKFMDGRIEQLSGNVTLVRY